MKTLYYSILIILVIPGSLLFGQCPTTSCTNYTASISTAAIEPCGGATLNLSGNLNNRSTCEDAPGDNCYLFVINRPTNSSTLGISADIGKGMGCMGEVNTFYTEIDGVCKNEGSSGSQNKFDFEFGSDNQIKIWLCDQSSGQVSLCGVCLLSALPVELAGFTGTPKFGAVELSWVTESELNNDLFEVQRSLDGSKFETIGEVTGNGTSTAMNYYKFMDKEALPFAYYRLKQMDFNGDFEYSPIISVEREGVPSKLLVYPSQAKEEITIRMETSSSRKSLLSIANTQGQLLRSIDYDGTNGTEYLRVDVGSYPPGIYYVTLAQELETITSKFIVVAD